VLFNTCNKLLNRKVFNDWFNDCQFSLYDIALCIVFLLLFTVCSRTRYWTKQWRRRQYDISTVWNQLNTTTRSRRQSLLTTFTNAVSKSVGVADGRRWWRAQTDRRQQTDVTVSWMPTSSVAVGGHLDHRCDGPVR